MTGTYALCFGLGVIFASSSALRADLIPNDPLYQPHQWALAKVNAPGAWAYSLGSPAVRIGVLDTGIDFNTPELQGRFLAPLNGVIPGAAEVTSSQVHGTWVVSTIAMPINNEIGGAGTGNFSILPIRVTNANGNASDLWIKQGISLAVSHDCRVITISMEALSSPDINNHVAQLRAARQASGERDFLVFMAAGNRNSSRMLGSESIDSAHLRPEIDCLIMVSGTDEDDGRWVTNASLGSDYGPFVDLAAPAHNILVANGSSVTVPYGVVSGTSFATPYAASAAALAFSINPDLTAGQVQTMLFDTAFNPNNPHPGTPYWDQEFGWGRVDFAGVAAAAAATVPEAGTLAVLGMGGLILLRRRAHRPSPAL